MVAALAEETLLLNPSAQPLSEALLNKHFLRKHGKDAYYGQPA
jgi:L-ribulose-5-phosphate 4-epimerase